MPKLSATIALNLKRFRELTGLSQEELGEKAGVERGTIARLESGKGKAGFDTVGKLAAVLRLEETDLFTVEGERLVEHPVEECYRRIGERLTLQSRRTPREDCLTYLTDIGVRADLVAMIRESVEKLEADKQRKNKKTQS